MADRKLFTYIPEEGTVDFGKDVLPKLTGQMYGWEISGCLIDIGTMGNYMKAKEEWNYDYNKDSLTR